MGVLNPTSMDDVAKAIDRISALEIALSRLESDRKEDLARINKDAGLEEKRLKKQKAELKKAIESYMRPKRKSLISSWGQKSVQLWSGVVGWRLSSIKVSIKKDTEEKTAKELIALGLEDCVEVKTTYSFHRNILKRHLDKIKNIKSISVSGGKRESFFVDTNAVLKKKAS